MKLSILYSNQPEVFPAIQFNPGLNVVLAEIRDPKNLSRDTHNLGKTTLAALVDFCLLKGKHKDFFLFKHEARFSSFDFYLELEVGEGEFVTIRRSIAEATKVSFKYATDSQKDLTCLSDQDWDHWRVPFTKSKELLDAKLNFSAATPWHFRNPLGYALRLQNDYSDVFQLGKFRGAHVDWKPFLAELVGLDGTLVQASYDLANEGEEISRSIADIEPQLAGLASSPDKLEGMILIRGREVKDLTDRLRNFDFKVPDEDVSENLVAEIETSIAALNERRYHLRMSSEAIERSQGDTIRFDLGSVERVFEDSKVYFGDQLKRDYSDLLAFLTSISEERNELLKEEKVDLLFELGEIDANLCELNAQRMDALSALREAKSLAKYRKHSEKLVDMKASLRILERQRVQMDHLSELRRKLKDIKQQRDNVLQAVEANLAQSTRAEGVYPGIRLDFGDIVQSVLNQSAVLSCKLNKESNLDFAAEILDKSGTATSADLGHTYKKLLCIAFDIAVFSAYLNERFLHFVFHDGIFESLDDRKKQCLLTEVHKRCDAGLQQVITVIDSDLPVDNDGNRLEFSEGDVIRLLHDEGDSGRLFQMPEW